VALLGWAQHLPGADGVGPFRLVFWLTLIPGLLAVAAFLIFVRDPEQSPNPALKFFSTLRGLPARFERYLAAVGIFGIGDFSPSLLILAATQLLTRPWASSTRRKLQAYSTYCTMRSRWCFPISQELGPPANPARFRSLHRTVGTSSWNRRPSMPSPPLAG
jgi:hypothetical protein